MWSQQGDHGVQWRWGGGCGQAVGRGAGHHDPPPRGGGETDRSLHLTGKSFLCAHSVYLIFCFDTHHVRCLIRHEGRSNKRPFPPHFLFCRWLKQIEETLDNCGDQADLLSDRFLCHLSSLHEPADINSLFYLFQPLSHIIYITAPPSPHVTVSTSCCAIVKKLLTLSLLLCSTGYSYNCSSIYTNFHIFACSVFLL